MDRKCDSDRGIKHSKHSRRIVAGVHAFIVPTPDEIAAAYGIPEAHRALPPCVPEWTEWLAKHSPIGQISQGSRVDDLHVKYDGAAQGRTPRSG